MNILLKAIRNLIEYFASITRPFREEAIASNRDIASADLLLVQSFGRRSFQDQGLGRKLNQLFGQTIGELGRFEILEKNNFQPGYSNFTMAETCLSLLQANPRLTVITQWEVAFALWRIAPYKVRSLVRDHRFFCVWPTGRYFSTWDVNVRSVEIVREHGFKKLLELAPPCMVVRAKMILWKLGVSPKLLMAEVPFDENSVQKWTRNLQSWVLREFFNRVRELAVNHIALLPPK